MNTRLVYVTFSRTLTPTTTTTTTTTTALKKLESDKIATREDNDKFVEVTRT